MREHIVFEHVGIKPVRFLALRMPLLPWSTFIFYDCILEHPSVSQMFYVSHCTAGMGNALFYLSSLGF